MRLISVSPTEFASFRGACLFGAALMCGQDFDRCTYQVLVAFCSVGFRCCALDPKLRRIKSCTHDLLFDRTESLQSGNRGP